MYTRPYPFTAGVAALVVFALLASACVPSVVAAPVVSNLSLRNDPTPRTALAAEQTLTCSSLEAAYPTNRLPTERAYPLRGDPSFEPDDLGPAARHWYDRLWDVISDPDWADRATGMATSDDLYTYGRDLHTHVQALLLAFRITGDLGLLDEVDRLAEHMRSRLRDEWRGTLDGSNGTRDGYLNWVYRLDDSRVHVGKDLFDFNEMRTHGLVAEIAWALFHNRDLASPNGVDYGHRADVWTTYLLEHFEPKWRERNGVRGTAFPFLSHDSLHATVAFIKYHHYLGRILEAPQYAREAERLSRLVLDAFRDVQVGQDVAVVWPGSLSDDKDKRLLRTTYARYVFGDAIDLHLDGAALWRDQSVPTSLAVTLREFLFAVDGDGLSLANDIGGGRSRGGLAPHDPDDTGTFAVERYAVSGLAFAAAWDPQGDLSRWSCDVYEAFSPGRASVHLPAAMLAVFGMDRAVQP